MSRKIKWSKYPRQKLEFHKLCVDCIKRFIQVSGTRNQQFVYTSGIEAGAKIWEEHFEMVNAVYFIEITTFLQTM